MQGPTLARRRAIASTLAVIGALVIPATAAQAAPPPPTDTVTVTGAGSGSPFPLFTDIAINAQSGTSGQNPSGTASFAFQSGPAADRVSGPVTCLRVTGPDQGAGTPGSPTTAILNVADPRGIVTLDVVDNGGNGSDLMSILTVFRQPTDCSPTSAPLFGPATLSSGRAVVFDASLLPTSRDQCKNSGWQSFGGAFKNQGQCTAFVERGPRTLTAGLESHLAPP
jgi:hypothetical protein